MAAGLLGRSAACGCGPFELLAARRLDRLGSALKLVLWGDVADAAVQAYLVVFMDVFVDQAARAGQ
jgi:hypothetical protein